MANTFEIRNRLDTEFEKESDRGCAILTLCVLEECLVELFAAFLPGGNHDARHFMPKGRLSAGIANAYMLGLIDESTRSNFKLLTDIRNMFAHGVLGGASFDSAAIRQKVGMLQLPDMESVPVFKTTLDSDPRRRFMMAADSLLFTLHWMAGKVLRISRVQNPTWKIMQGAVGSLVELP